MVASILFRSWHGLAFGGLNGLVSGRCRGRGGRSRVLLLDETGQVGPDQARGIVEALRRIDKAADGSADSPVADERHFGEPPNQAIGFVDRDLFTAREMKCG